MNEQSPPRREATNEELLSSAIEHLRKESATDTQLLDILATHIVKLAPAKTAVNDAAQAIEALAIKRAEESQNDPADHD